MFNITTLGEWTGTATHSDMREAFQHATILSRVHGLVVVTNTTNERTVYLADGQVSVYVSAGEHLQSAPRRKAN